MMQKKKRRGRAEHNHVTDLASVGLIVADATSDRRGDMMERKYSDVAAAFGQPRFSVIINTFNRADTLVDCLIALKRQTYAAFEVIVVCGPCTDGTLDVLAEYQSDLKISHCPERNLSISRNLGVAAAAGDVCAFIDDDAVAHPRWLEQLAKHYNNDMVGGVGGFTIDNTGASFQCRYTVCDRFGNATLLDHIDPSSRLSHPGLWLFPSLLGTNSSFRTALLRRIGGFDEFFEYMLDETDVCARINDLGFAIVTAPDALVFHRYAASHLRDQRRIAKTQLAPSRSKAYFVFKHTRTRLPLAEISAELDRFRTDLRFSNRWHVDRAMIASGHFLRLNREIETGLKQGVEHGLAADRGGNVPAPCVGDDAAPCRAEIGAQPFRRYIAAAPAQALKIALVSQGFPPNDTSGIARWTHELALALVARGHEVHVITAAAESRVIEYRRGVWLHAVPPVAKTNAVTPVDLPPPILARAAAVLGEALRIQRDFGLDVVSAPIWDVEGILCAANLDIPVITSLHTAYRMVLPLKDQWRNDLDFRLNHVERIIGAETWLLRNAPLLLANSREIVRELQAWYAVPLPPARVAVVPHGLRQPEPHEGAVSPSDGRARVLYVGRIERRKGLDLLLRAIAPLLIEYQSLALDIVGAEVPAEAEYTALIAQLRDEIDARALAARVKFRGYVSETDLAGYYAACDLFVAPSRFESFGLIAIEAMRFGKPVIAARTGGLIEIVEPGLSGELFEPDSVEDLRASLRRLLADPARRQRQGRHARAAFRRRFTSAAMAASVEHRLRDLLLGRPAPEADGATPESPGDHVNDSVMDEIETAAIAAAA